MSGTTTAPAGARATSATTSGVPPRVAGPPALGEAARQPRLDLQGVRGLGVTLVVVGHLFDWPKGVFAALDMFFVLSGFLITGILVGSLGRYGPRFFPVFYLSRARRLVPMAVVVLVFTVVGTWLAYSTARAELVLTDAVWAFAFAVNWHFIDQGTDYFALHTASPLQHYWSLSVEEQFYVVWPVLVLLALAVAARAVRPERRVWVVAGVLGAVTAASFAYSLWHSASYPVASYFSTLDRAWEFGAGGLLALAANRLTRLPRPVKVLCSWAGVLGVFVTIFVFDTGLAFPAPWGLVPVAMTALVIVGGLATDTRHNVVLHNPVMVYVGNISYSVYLWHMPVQVILLPCFGVRSLAYFATCLLATAVLSVLGHHTVEKPLRGARWLMTPAERARVPRRPLFEPRVGRALGAAQGYLVIGGVLGLIYLGLVVARSGALAPAAADPPPAEVAAQTTRLQQALDADDFPAFSPSLAELTASTWDVEHGEVSCVDVDPADLGACRFGPADAPRTVAVVGDSFAVAWMPAVLGAFVPAGWDVQQLTLTQCAPWAMPSYVKADGSPYPECEAMRAAVGQWVATEQPDLVIVADSYDQVRNADRLGVDPTGLAESGLLASLQGLAVPGVRLAVLQPPPPHVPLIDCVTNAGSPQDCVSRPTEGWTQQTTGEAAAAEAAGATYVETEDWFCVDGRCPGFVGSTPVTVEGTHLTVPFAQQMSGLLAASFADLLTTGALPAQSDAPAPAEAGTGAPEVTAATP